MLHLGQLPEYAELSMGQNVTVSRVPNRLFFTLTMAQGVPSMPDAVGESDTQAKVPNRPEVSLMADVPRSETPGRWAAFLSGLSGTFGLFPRMPEKPMTSDLERAMERVAATIHRAARTSHG
ncbi:hypothetical protein [Promicromonospora sp. NFX87]|uniref:hypothetical protein n=1 Tax=Promicromonospora sp. NFX87 TaxID=3402691 RepID=UPI003AFA8EBB